MHLKSRRLSDISAPKFENMVVRDGFKVFEMHVLYMSSALHRRRLLFVYSI